MRDTWGLTISGETIRTHLWKCKDCPFETSDRDAYFGHVNYTDSNPSGWLGDGMAHTMAVHPDVIRYADQWKR